jgi:hypothetical protein
MSFELSDEDLVKSGAKIVRRTALPTPAVPSVDAQLLTELRGLVIAMKAVAARPIPDVNVSAPAVSVKPTFSVATHKQPRKWRFEVTERDKTSDQRIKTMTIEAIE